MSEATARKTPAPTKPLRPETKKARAERRRIIRDRECRAAAAAAKPEELVDFALPEVELVRKDLDKEISGLEIERAEAASMKCVRSYYFRKDFLKWLPGATITKVSRVGLYITAELSTGNLLVMSLGASGSPQRLPRDGELLDHTEVVIWFTDAEKGKLSFVDPVGTGQLFVVPAEKFETHLPETKDYGHDPLKPVAWTQMGQWLLKRDAHLKELLTDDEFLVGIGDIYADEILFEAGLRHDRAANTLATQGIRRLHRALGSTLFNAMKYGGTSVSCRPFTRPSGLPGAYGAHLKVWGLDGQLSATSREPIERVRYGGNWTYYSNTQV